MRDTYGCSHLDDASLRRLAAIEELRRRERATRQMFIEASDRRR